MISLNTSKKLFSEIPEKQAIAFKGQYSDRRCETILEITPTSGGFGLQGGVLFKSSTDKYIVKCPACIKANPKDRRQFKGQR
jgi:hypothetical protein